MSTFQAVKSLRTFASALVNGYIIVSFNKQITSDLINLCILYLFILDEFDKTTSSDALINGLNNTIATTYSEGSKGIIYTRNLIKADGDGIYHWKFKISSFAVPSVTFNLCYNETLFQICAHTDYFNFKIDDMILHIHLDIKYKIIAFKWQYYDDYTTKRLSDCSQKKKNQFKYNSNDYYRLCINTNFELTTIELIAYHDSNWYKNKLSQNNVDPLSHIGYARCIYDIDEKLKHYDIALKTYPLIESWNNEYLFCLIWKKQFVTAYKHSLQFKLGLNGIGELAVHYYDEDNIEFAHNLFLLLNDEELIKKDLCFEAAYSSSKSKEKGKALKLYELYYNQYVDNDDAINNIKLCIGNMVSIYLNKEFDDFEAALPLLLKLDEKEIERKKFNGKLGYCYRRKKEFDKALYFYELHLSQCPESRWGYLEMAFCYDDQEKYEMGMKYSLKALEYAQTDTAKALTLCNIGVSLYFQGKLEDAIKYTQQSLKYDIPRNKTAVKKNNLGKYYYKSGKYKKAYKYLSDAIDIKPNIIDIIGNYGISLYYLHKIDESIIYLKKSIDKIEKIEDNELSIDCLYIYGEILFQKNKYNQSIKICLQSINNNDFNKYKYKDNIYYLLSNNYRKLLKYDKSMQYLFKSKNANPNNDKYQLEIDELVQNNDPTELHYL